jgi:hypothetical protein
MGQAAAPLLFASVLTMATQRRIYENPQTNTSTQIPRHTDINELVIKEGHIAHK